MSLPDNQTIYANLIKALSENQFKELVQVLNKCKYETKDVVITDGCYDGGNDLRIIKSGKDIRRNIQVTVQTTGFEAKVMDDVAKAAKNVKHNAYLAQLDYYVNYRISLDKQNNLSTKAETDYGITLRFYDGSSLANLVLEYPRLRTWLHDVQLSAFPNDNKSPLNLDDRTKILYDSISMGAGSQEMKGSFISAYFLYYLYEKGSSTVSEVSDYLDSIFFKRIKRGYYASLAGTLVRSSSIEAVPGTKPKEYVLSNESRIHLDTLLAFSEREERKIIAECESLLSRYGVTLDIQDLARNITDLFDENYRVDIYELTTHEQNGESQLNKISSRLIQYVTEKTPGLTPESRTRLVEEILQIFTSSDVFNRNSVSKMFLTLFQDDKLDEYLSRQSRTIIWDTQVLLRLLSLLLFGDSHISDSSYDVVKSLRTAIKESSVPIHSYATYGYIKETAIHVREAIRLERFLSIPGFKYLGKSKNVIFNYYDEIQSQTDLGSLSDYLSDKLNVDISLPDRQLDDEIFNSLFDILKLSEIEPISTSSIPDNEGYQRQYDFALSDGVGSKKSQSARHHDLNALLLLSRFADEEGQTAYLITWDKTFYKVRESFSKFKELNEWYIYSPQKFTNTLSVINFQVDVSSVNSGIISIMNDINAGNEQPSVIDLLSSMFAGKQLKGIDFINAFKQMRQSLLIKEEERESNNAIPIDEMLDKVVSHYKSNDQSFSKFVDLLSSPEYASLIIDVFKDNIDSFTISSSDTIQKMITRIDGVLDEFEYEE